MTTSYVAPADHSLGATWSAGSQELTDVDSLFTDAVSDHDALAAVFDTGAAALDVLGDIGDPLHAAIGTAVGWFVDHVAFLREPVDWLAGDPVSIQAAVTTWGNVSAGMGRDADRLAAVVGSLSGDAWSGDAADAYRTRAAQWVTALHSSASMAELESALIAATGGLCAGVRALIFEAITDAVEQWVITGLVALANSAWTFGASIAAWLIDVEIDAGLLAARISAKLAELVEKLGRIAETLGRDGGRLEQIGDKLVQLSDRMGHDVRSSRSLLGWDRRYSNTPRPGLAAHQADADHLLRSLQAAGKHLHVKLAHVALVESRDGAEAAQDPSVTHLDKLAGDTADNATGAARHALHGHPDAGSGQR